MCWRLWLRSGRTCLPDGSSPSNWRFSAESGRNAEPDQYDVPDGDVQDPTLFAMVGALYFSLRAVETGKYPFAALAGALAGWGAHCAVPLVALLPAIGLLLWFAPACRRIRLAIVILSAAAAVLLPPVGWFAYKSGKPTISTSAARHLYNRVVYEQRQLDRTGPATRTLLEILDGEDPRKLPFWHLLHRPGFKQLPKGFNVDQLLMMSPGKEF